MIGQLHLVGGDVIKDVMLVLIGLLGIWLMVAQVRAGGRTRIDPQPLEVKASPEWVTKTECVTSHAHFETRVERLESQVEEIRRTMGADKVELLEAGEQRARRLHQRIDGVAEELRQMPRHIVDLITKSKQI